MWRGPALSASLCLGSAWLCEALPGPVCRPLLCLPARSNPLSSPHLFVLASPKIHQDSHIIAYLASQPAPTLLSPSFACSQSFKDILSTKIHYPKDSLSFNQHTSARSVKKKHINQDGDGVLIHPCHSKQLSYPGPALVRCLPCPSGLRSQTLLSQTKQSEGWNWILLDSPPCGSPKTSSWGRCKKQRKWLIKAE